MKAERHWRTVSVTCGYCHETMSRTDFDGHLSGCMKASRGGSDVVANPESEQEAEAVSEAARRMENERKQEALTVLEAHTPSTPAVSNPGESEVQEQNALSFAIEKALFGSDHYSPVRTKGVKAHRDAIYKLSLTDQTAAQILDLLKELAVRSGSFIEIRNAVLLHEVLMWKLRGQGY